MHNYELLSAVVVVLLIVLIGYHFFYVTGDQVAGYWAEPENGALFHVVRPLGLRNYYVTTASNYMGARPGRLYPILTGVRRSIAVGFPSGVLRGRVAPNRRRIFWGRGRGGRRWRRQGV